MGFWKTFGKWAIPAGAIAATVLTAGAASPLIPMAIGAGAGFGSGMVGGQGWKKSLIGAGIGGALGGIGGGALKGMGNVGKVATQAAKYAPAAVGAAKGLTAGLRAPSGGGLSGPGYRPMDEVPRGEMPMGQGWLTPTDFQRRTNLAGMGTRQYA